MKIGFACLTVGVDQTQMRTCRKASATDDNLRRIIANNLQATENILLYCIQQDLKMYRMSSDLIPFGSDLETNSLDWASEFQAAFKRIGQLIRDHQIRTSMHPGQYTVLNSPDAGVVQRAIADLEYHNKIMDAMGLDRTHKIILHIGGVYGDKPSAKSRFIATYQTLSPQVKSRLIIENDDRLYHIQDVLEISQATGAPVVYDNLHNACNLADPSKSDAHWITLAKQTWTSEDGPAKVHYSQQRPNGRLGAHTSTIYLEPFLKYYQEVGPLEVDIMLEVKDKNLSAVKVHLATQAGAHIKQLEAEWALYKYSVLLHSPRHYQAIRQILKDKTAYPVRDFYHLIEGALDTEVSLKTALNGIDHVWGHLKNLATKKERGSFADLREKYLREEISLNRVKAWLKRLATKYGESYLLQSLFFDLE